MYPGHGTAYQVIFSRGFELILHLFVCICIESNSKCVHFSQRYQTGVHEVEEYSKHVRFDVFHHDEVSQILFDQMLKNVLKDLTS